MIILCIRPAIFELNEYLGIPTEIRDSEELDNLGVVRSNGVKF